LNGEIYGGGRQSQDFLRAICQVLDEKPAACNDLPEEPKFELIVLTDERCEDCKAMVTRITPQLKQLFPGMSVKEMDYSNTQGKNLYESNNVQYLPAFLFPEQVETASNYAQISRYLRPAGDYQSLAVGSDFDPTKEICENGKDDTGNGLIDCEDPDCEQSLVCREENPQHLAVFVMSECPYGTRALDAMNEVLANFKDEITFEVNYIASYNNETDSFNALHGQSEVDENIRQLCAAKYYPENNKYMEYIWCRNEDITSTDWESCAQMADLDEQKIAECSEGEEGVKLLKDNIKLADSLGIGASPTWLVNNKYTFSGITAEVVKTNFCKYNEDVAGCENTLTAKSDIPAGGC
ncbi:MAG: hypothetical protein GF334_13830, partial [Candidatus Altiarchaeales archaeon]|nr:hypothetical protein [Candidatus Altiarchaeales archaeon]